MAIWTFSKAAGITVLSALLSVAGVAVAWAETIKIGMVDFALDHAALKKFDNVTVRSITFQTSNMVPARFQSTKNSKGHADVMAAALIESFQTAAPGNDLELYVATPFLQDPDSGKQTVDFEQLEFAYMWFARQGVKIVAQTFVSRDNPYLEAAIDAARNDGLVILTSAGNGPRENVVPPYPASYGGLISISTTGLQSELRKEEARNTYVRYSVPAPAISTMKVRQDPDAAALAGSSHATVTAAGLLAALSTRYQLSSVEDAMQILDAVATPIAQFGTKAAYGVGVLVQDMVAQHLRISIPHPQLRRLVRQDRMDA